MITPQAELRGTRPIAPAGVVLMLHGGAERSRSALAWSSPPVLRMRALASVLERAGGGRLAIVRLKNAVRGWNGEREDPVVAARWALNVIHRELPGVPVVVIGHSMGGRVALRLADDPSVVGVAGLAPWIERGDPIVPGPGQAVLLMHGERDTVTKPKSTAWLAQELLERGVAVSWHLIPGETHAMLRRPATWHITTSRWVRQLLLPTMRGHLTR